MPVKGLNERFILVMKDIIAKGKKGCDTQKAFCDVMGMHPPAISQIKAGAMPTHENINAMGTIFGASANFIYFNELPMYRTETKQDRLSRVEEKIADIEKRFGRRTFS